MKNKLFKIILTVFILSITAFTFACNGFGDVKRVIADKFLAVIDGTFTSADYVVAGSSSGDEGNKDAKSMSVELMSLVSSSNSTYGEKLEEITRAFYGVEGGVPLTEDNKKALNGEALSTGSPFAAMARALANIYGDNAFSNNYTFSEVTFKMTGNDNDFTINGVMNENGKMTSGFQMRFLKEGDGSYSYAQIMYSLLNSCEELKISSFSKKGVLSVELESTSEVDFNSYDTSYDKFRINKVTSANFDIENYASTEFLYNGEGSTALQNELVLGFAKNVLGFNNDTYKYLCGIKSTKEISKDELVKLSSEVNSSYYVSPYYYQTNTTYVKEEYVVPSDVTVVKTGSIPATKRVILHGNVTKIESRPFLQPQYLEEIVFDETSNKLTQIGSFDSKNGLPTFILSMTKVKNFKLPASVKKLELGDYVLNTKVELIDLSAYNPNWINDKNEFNFTFNDDFYKDNYEAYDMDTYRTAAYATLKIKGIEKYMYKELRYIETFKMPQFNMGIEYSDGGFYRVYDANGEEYYCEPFSEYDDILSELESGVAEYFESRNFTEVFEVIDTLVVHDNNQILSEDLLFGDLIDEKGRGFSREDFPVEFYYYIDQNKFGQTFKGEYRSINKILVSEKDYDAIKTIELNYYNGNSDDINGDRVTISKKG